MDRIAPSPMRQIHEMAIGYLLDTLRAVSVKMHGIEDEYAPTLDAEYLALWNVQYRSELARCTGYLRGYNFTGVPKLSALNPHEDALFYFDNLINALKSGEDVTTEDAQHHINNLRECKDDYIKY